MYEKPESSLIDVIISKGFQHYAKMAYEVIKLPVAIFDFEFRHLTHYPDENIGEIFFPLDRISDNENARRVPRQKGVFVLKEGAYKDHPRIIGNVFSCENNSAEDVIGFVNVSCETLVDITKKRLDFLDYFCKAISIEFLRQDMYKAHYANNSAAILMARLFANRAPNDAQYQCILESFRKKLKANFAVLALQQSKADEVNGKQTALSGLHRNICAIISEYSPVLLNNSIFLLLDNIQNKKNLLDKCHKILAALNPWNLKLGISNIFCDIKEIKIYQDQADFALKNAQTSEKNHLFYENCVIERIKQLILGHILKENYTHPALQILRDYDELNGTDYAKTLLVFIISGQRYTQALKKLHIHRNTLSYRLDIIKKITNIELDDVDTCTHLAFNYYLSQDHQSSS